jgi:transcriptional regulator with XRE-family HTH domain
VRKGEIGRRIRAVRRERGLTLRQVAAAAALSATHISEIERGHTTPTVGALLRVAQALGKEPHFFLETERLPEVSLVRAADERRIHDLRAPRGTYEALTHGIPGNRILATRTVLQPHSTDSDVFAFSGEEGGYLISGEIEIHVGEVSFQIKAGDGFHLRSDLPHTVYNRGDVPAVIVWVTTHTPSGGSLMS